ncbi:MAG TPA: cupredoxin domain-containing protein [Ilumatobacteraceae bacterium]|nr:cupredoxin domain-containing protein [Ilumatobacteraceae bacterium]
MENKRNGDAWWVITFVIGMTALIVSVIGVAVASGKSDSSSAGSSAGASAGGAAADGVTEVDVTLADISVTPKMIQVPAGKEITLHITNTGAMEHDLKVEGLQGTGMMKPGEKTDLVIGPFTADTELWCTVPGHKAAGMLMAVHVLGGDAATPPASGGTAADPYAGDAVIDSAAIPVRLAAVGRISVHLTASYLTFGQIAADSVTKGPALPCGVSYEDAM